MTFVETISNLNISINFLRHNNLLYKSYNLLIIKYI